MLARFFIDRPIFATVVSVVITLCGGIAMVALPIAQYPQITPPSVSLSISYPGANAQVVQDTIAAPIEQAVNGVIEELARLSPRYLEITKISSNIWWNAARDSFSTGLGMLVQAIGSPDMVEGATAFLEKRRPQFPSPE